MVNTERERRKTKNVEANPKVGISMTDPDNPYRFLSVFGDVTGTRRVPVGSRDACIS